MERLKPPACGSSAGAASIDFDGAQAVLATHAQALGTEMVRLAEAGGRCLAEPVLARIDGPRLDTSAMDGFAVRDADVAAGRMGFRIVGDSFPAARAECRVAAGEAVRITTGAPIPAGADRVVMREDTIADGETMWLTIPQLGKTHVRKQGSDFATGETIVAAGRLIEPRTLVAAAAADVGSLTVWRQPAVAVISTGNELVEPGFAARSSQAVPDSLSDAILLSCRQWGATSVTGMRAKDQPGAIEREAAGLIDGCDVLVMIGGASRGERDFSKAGLRPLGLQIAFSDVAVKPGKPVWYGRIGARHVIGLPGNPTAAMTMARLFLVPLVTALGGRGIAAGLDWQPLPLAEDAAAGSDRESFLCAERRSDGVAIIARQSASGQAMLARSDVLVRQSPLSGPLPRGSIVQTLRF